MADRYPPQHDHEDIEVHHVHHDATPDPVVVERDSGSGFGMVLGIILALVLALVLLYFAFGSNMFGTTGPTTVQPNNGPTININPPAQSAPPAQSGGSGTGAQPNSPVGPGAGSGAGSGAATP